jgi:hypothetical protein
MSVPLINLTQQCLLFMLQRENAQIIKNYTMILILIVHKFQKDFNTDINSIVTAQIIITGGMNTLVPLLNPLEDWYCANKRIPIII